MEPEISHRCPLCGASFRTGAQFCPQCGGALDGAAAEAPKLPATKKLKRGKRTIRSLPSTPLAVKSDTHELLFVAAKPQEEQVSPVSEISVESVSTQAVGDNDANPSKRQRVKNVAREIVVENVRPHVEKLRHASSVVFEEAAIDPSLRFVLIALFLFIVFIVLLVISFIR